MFKLSQEHNTLKGISPDDIDLKVHHLTSIPDENTLKMQLKQFNIKTKFEGKIKLESSNKLAYITEMKERNCSNDILRDLNTHTVNVT